MDKVSGSRHSAEPPRSSSDRVLAAVDRKGFATRQEISQLTGLSRSAVATVVHTLVRRGLLTEEPGPQNGRGRPALIVRRTREAGLLAGLSFDHHDVAVALGDAHAQPLAETRLPVSIDNDPHAAIHKAKEALTGLLTDQGKTLADLSGVAAGIPGPLTRHGHGIPYMLGHGQMNQPQQAIEQVLGLPVAAVNDVVLGALGEMQIQGRAFGVEDFIYIKASYGIGACLVLGGQVYRGSGGMAGEIGHTRVPRFQQRCRCGNLGCLETRAGIDGLLQELPHPFGSRHLLEPQGPDPVISRIVYDAARLIGDTLAPVCNALNPSMIITAGILGTVHSEAFIRGLRESLDSRIQPAIASALQVAPPAYGARSETFGALALARRQTITSAG